MMRAKLPAVLHTVPLNLALNLALLLACAPLQAEESSWWQANRIDASVRWDSFYAPRHQASIPASTRTSILQVRALPRWGEELDAQINLRASSSNTARQREANPALLEAFVTRHWSQFDISLGKQIIVWGRADGINPTDNISPRDQLSWLPFENDQRFGVWGVRVNRYFEQGLNAQVFVSPWFNPTLSVRPELANPVAQSDPARNSRNAVLALKLDQSGGATDWSLSYFRGPSVLADVRLVGRNALGPVLAQHHDRVQVWGADFAKNLGRVGMRGELAWQQVFNSDDDGAAVKKNNWYAVLGVDRTFDDTLNLNLQWYGKYLPDYADPNRIAEPVARYVAVQNAISDGQQDRFNQGWSLRINKKWLGETLESDVLITYNRVRHDRFIRPTLSYNVSDRIKVVAGGIFFDGKSESLFGRKRNESRIVAELRYVF